MKLKCLPAYLATRLPLCKQGRHLDDIEVPTCLPAYLSTTVETGQTLSLR